MGLVTIWRVAVEKLVRSVHIGKTKRQNALQTIFSDCRDISGHPLFEETDFFNSYACFRQLSGAAFLVVRNKIEIDFVF
jgi:hypothetical protein